MNYKSKLYKNYSSTINNINSKIKMTFDHFKSKFYSFDFYYSELLPSHFDANILDIGCGEGIFIHYLETKGYTNIYGVDISEEQIALGKEFGIKNIQEIDMLVFLKDKFDCYDCIIARDILEHFTKTEIFNILKLVNLSLKKNGYLLLQVPNAEGINFNSHYFGDFTHETCFTTKSLTQVSLNTGFKHIEIFPVNPCSKGLKGKFRSYLWEIKVFQYRFWKYIETGNKSGIFTSNLIAILKK
jgi:2-polyprenyl-3-methyl-5-hydroxy-6-metoxy-1,4-benzoquinol methylase